MSKKKIVTVCLVVALLATGLIGGSLAYFTDEEAKENVFTTGNVDITLEEDFVQGSQLKPGIDVNKDAWIENTGVNDAWVWAEVLIPAVLDDGITNSPVAPGLKNSLHVNFPGAYSKEYAQNKDAAAKFYNAELEQLWIHQYNADGIQYGYVGQETIEGVVYNKYVKFYETKLAAGTATSKFLDKVYMDKAVAQCTDDNCEGLILVDGSCYTDEWNLLVRAYAMQADGFNSVIDAYKAYIAE